MRSGAFFVALLIVLASASAVSVVTSQYEARKLYTEIEYEKKRMIELDREWKKLGIEKDTLVTHRRVAEIAADRLNMALPTMEQIVMLENTR